MGGSGMSDITPKPPMIELLGGLIVFAFVTWRLIDEFIEKEKNN